MSHDGPPDRGLLAKQRGPRTGERCWCQHQGSGCKDSSRVVQRGEEPFPRSSEGGRSPEARRARGPNSASLYQLEGSDPGLLPLRILCRLANTSASSKPQVFSIKNFQLSLTHFSFKLIPRRAVRSALKELRAGKRSCRWTEVLVSSCLSLPLERLPLRLALSAVHTYSCAHMFGTWAGCSSRDVSPRALDLAPLAWAQSWGVGFPLTWSKEGLREDEWSAWENLVAESSSCSFPGMCGQDKAAPLG